MHTHTCTGLVLALPDPVDSDEGPPAPLSITACLAELQGPHRLSGDDQYDCDVCGGKRDATLTRELGELPPALLLMLRRTRYSVARGQYKDLRHVIFESIFDVDGLLAVSK